MGTENLPGGTLRNTSSKGKSTNEKEGPKKERARNAAHKELDRLHWRTKQEANPPAVIWLSREECWIWDGTESSRKGSKRIALEQPRVKRIVGPEPKES